MSAHKDLLGREVNVGDYVVHDMKIYNIIKLTPKMIVGAKVGSTKPASQNKSHVYARLCVIVPEEDVTMWLLTKPAK